jgi:AmiR/NasT family two-component response regulator
MEDDIIEQAQARVAAQLGCSIERAFEVMTDTARATDETIEHLAAEIVAGRLTFD